MNCIERPYDLALYEARVRAIQNAPRMPCQLDRLEKVVFLTGSVVGTIALALLSPPAMGLAAIALPALAAANGITIPLAARRLRQSFGHCDAPQPKKLRLHGFHLLDIVDNRKKSEHLVRWLQTKHFVSRGSERLVLQVPTAQQLMNDGSLTVILGYITGILAWHIHDYLRITRTESLPS